MPESFKQVRPPEAAPVYPAARSLRLLIPDFAMTPSPVTLRSPLGFAFRIFAFTILVCAFTCYRAIAFSWGTAGTHQYTRDDVVFSSSEWLGGSPGYCRTYTGTEI